MLQLRHPLLRHSESQQMMHLFTRRLILHFLPSSPPQRLLWMKCTAVQLHLRPSYSKTRREAAVFLPAQLFRAVSSNVVNSQRRQGGCEALQCKCTSVTNRVCQCAATLYLHQFSFQKKPPKKAKKLPVSTQMCCTYSHN